MKRTSEYDMRHATKVRQRAVPYFYHYLISFTQLHSLRLKINLWKSGKETRRLSAQSQTLSCNFSQGPGRRRRKERDCSHTIPCLGEVLNLFRTGEVKLYTLFRTARPKNHTLSSGTYPCNTNKGVPHPSGINFKLQVPPIVDNNFP